MRKLVTIIVLLVIGVVVAAVAASILVPVAAYKGQVLSLIEQKTGKHITIDGPISLSVWPDIAFKAENVTVANPAWAGGGNMVTVDNVRVGLALLPLLHKQIILRELTLVKPSILLVQKGTQQNWQMTTSQPTPVTSSGKQPTAGGYALNLGAIGIEHGQVVYKDLAQNKPITLSDVDLTLSAGNLKGPASLKGNATFEGKRHELKANIDRLESLGKTSSPVSLTWNADKMSVSLSGSLAVKTGGAVPEITADLKTDTLDLNALMPGSGPVVSGNGSAKPSVSGWSDAPLDYSALRAVNANVTLAIGTLRFKQTTVKPVNLTIALKSGSLTAQAKQMGLYSGTADAVVKANASGNVALDVVVAGMQAEPLLKDFADFDRLKATLKGNLHVTANGQSQRQLVSHLNGNGSFNMENGKFIGRNIFKMMQNIPSAFTKAPAQNEDTTFSDATGSFTIVGGVLSNKDLQVQSPLVRLAGEGTVDLSAQRVNYLLKPKLVASLQGQGAKAGEAGITVPVRITGPFNNLSWTPDLSGILTNVLQNPASLKETVKSFKELKGSVKPKDLLKGLLGGTGR